MEISHEWSFGEDKELADRLKRLVLEGKKKATTGLLYEGKKVPQVGDFEAIIDSDGKRFCIIKLTKVEVKPFLGVEFDFVEKEGEGDKSIEEWRENFRKFFGPQEDNPTVICTEFELVDQRSDRL